MPLTISCSSKSRLVLTFLVLPFWYLLTQVVLDIFQKSSKTVVCECVCASFITKDVEMLVFYRSPDRLICKQMKKLIESLLPLLLRLLLLQLMVSPFTLHDVDNERLSGGWIEQGGCRGSYYMNEADKGRLMTTMGVSG